MSDARVVLPEPDADETGPYTHLGFATAKPGCEDQVEELILGLVEPLRAEEGSSSSTSTATARTGRGS